jgi:mevalonate kinase
MVLFFNFLIEDIGVGHESLDEICTISSSYGYHAKLTGAGGGGCAYLLLWKDNQEKRQEMKNEFEKRGYYCFETKIGGEGLKII